MEQQETLSKIEKVTKGVIEALGVTVNQIGCEWEDQQERIYIKVEAGEDNGFLIGKDGRMLEALKEIIESAVSRSENRTINMYLDVGDYWKKIETKTLEQAKQACDDVRLYWS